MVHTAGAKPGFYSMKQLVVLLLFPEWDAILSQGDVVQTERLRYPFIHLGPVVQSPIKLILG